MTFLRGETSQKKHETKLPQLLEYCLKMLKIRPAFYIDSFVVRTGSVVYSSVFVCTRITSIWRLSSGVVQRYCEIVMDVWLQQQ